MPPQDSSTSQPAAAAAGQQTAENLPPFPKGEWPGAFGIYKFSRAAIRYNLNTIVIIYLLMIGASFLLSFIPIIGKIASFVISAAGTVAMTFAILGALERRKVEVQQSIKDSTPLIVNMLILQILVTVSYIGSFLLLVVPFFFVAPRLVLANYYLIDKKMDPIEAYKASWAATSGHVGKVYGIVGAGLAMMLLFFTIIGIPFAIYFLIMYSAAFVILYKFVDASEPAVAQVKPAETPVTNSEPEAPATPEVAEAPAQTSATDTSNEVASDNQDEPAQPAA